MTPSHCSRCDQDAVIELPYMSQSLCLEHFNRHFEKRFTNTVRQHRLFSDGEKIGVGLSGGKDSILLIHLLQKFFRHTNELHAIIIDEGIPGYRDQAIALATKTCQNLGVQYTIVKFEDEFGLTNTDTANALALEPGLGKGVCGFCGTFRRSILNKYARQLGLNKLATGHNLDDEAQSILMNVFDNHFDKFVRQGPVAGDGEKNESGMIPRIKPLFDSPEKEIIAYCALNGIEHFSENCCPHSKRAKRNDFRQLLNDFEAKYPGTKYSIQKFLLESKSRLKLAPMASNPPTPCGECGEPGNGEMCHACQNKKKILKVLEQARIQVGAAPIMPVNRDTDSGPTCNELKNQAT